MIVKYLTMNIIRNNLHKLYDKQTKHQNCKLALVHYNSMGTHTSRVGGGGGGGGLFPIESCGAKAVAMLVTLAAILGTMVIS